MTCDAVQNRLLAVTEPRRAGADVRTHLAGCPDCRQYVARAARLEELLTQLPVPAARPEAKAKLLTDILTAPATRRPVATPRRTLPALAGVRWTHVAAVAAGLLLAVGVWWGNGTRRPGDAPETAGVRHELLQKEVRHFVALSKTESPTQRMAIWADVATDLRGEAREVYLIAPEDDMKAIGKLFDRAVREGILQQAAQFQTHMPAAEKQRALTTAADRLKDAEAEADRLSAAAPPNSQAVLRNMAKTAREGRKQIQDLVAKGGA